ncbi:MAG: hypothetical protein HN742_41090 [Lentisphaerae bacterium]|nr:hypothetical protein [Lentisphaerota bacterium]MBT7848333.1 hypothetical protein [Lentisphaerota bacterium]
MRRTTVMMTIAVASAIFGQVPVKGPLQPASAEERGRTHVSGARLGGAFRASGRTRPMSPSSCESLLWDFSEDSSAGVRVDAGEGLTMAFRSSGQGAVSYVLQGQEALELSWSEGGRYELVISLPRTVVLEGSSRLMCDLYVPREGSVPGGISLGLGVQGDFRHPGRLHSGVWNSLTFKTEGVAVVLGAPLCLQIEAAEAGRVALDRLRLVQLEPQWLSASGHERRCDLRWSPLYTHGFDHYNVYRSPLSGGPQWEALSPWSERGHATLPAYSDFHAANGGRWRYRIGATVDGSEHFSTIREAGPRAENDEEYLESVQWATFMFSWQLAHPFSGLVETNGPLLGSHGNVGSHGLSLSSAPALIERGYVDRRAAADWVLRSLRFLYYHCDDYRGFLQHLINAYTGKSRTGFDTSETSFFIMGALVARQYFNGNSPAETEIRELGTRLYRRLDYPHMLSPEKGHERHLRWGFNPRKVDPNDPAADGWWGLIIGYHESSSSYLLGLGSPTYPLPVECWHDGWVKHAINGRKYYGYRHWVGSNERSLFLDTMSHLGIDPHYRDNNTQYFANAANVVRAHREYHIDNPKGHRNYGPDEWGQNAIVLPETGYTHDKVMRKDNGNISPLGPLQVMPYAPDICVRASRHLYNTYGSRIFNAFGFTFGFNATDNRFAGFVSSIDSQMIPGMIENARTGLIWRLGAANPEIHQALRRIRATYHPKAGLRLAIYHLEQEDYVGWQGFSLLDGREPAASPEVVSTPRDHWRDREQDYAHRYRGALVIREGGEYRFFVEGGNDSRLLIDGQVVASQGKLGPYGGRCEGKLKLAAGVHALQLEWLRREWRAKVSFEWDGPDSGGNRERVPVRSLRTEVDCNLPPQWYGAQRMPLCPGHPVDALVFCRDHDDDPVRITARGLPPWLQCQDLGDGRARLHGHVPPEWGGPLELFLQADDGRGQTDWPLLLESERNR